MKEGRERLRMRKRKLLVFLVVLVVLSLLAGAFWLSYFELRLIPDKWQWYSPFKFRPGEVEGEPFEVRVEYSDGSCGAIYSMYGADPGANFLGDVDTAEFKAAVFDEKAWRNAPFAHIYVRGLRSGEIEYRQELDMIPLYVSILNYKEHIYFDNQGPKGYDWYYMELTDEEYNKYYVDKIVRDYIGVLDKWDGESELVVLLGGGSWSHIYDVVVGHVLDDALFYPPPGWEKSAYRAVPSWEAY